MISQVEEIKKRFTQELRNAAAGKKTSLPFIKQQLPSHSLIKDGQIFQVLVIGGSVFQKALVRKQDHQLIILNNHQEDQPHFLTKEGFLDYIAKHIEPSISVVAINFAYPLTPDGKLVATSKENTFTGLVGEQVGKAIEEYIQQTLQQKIVIAVANDVICLLLSGLDTYTKESLCGAIMGTGTNITFFQDDFAVNLESANFDKFTPSEECLEIDQISADPGNALFEKEVAGRYLYEHFNLLLKKNNVHAPELRSTQELTEIAGQTGAELSPALSYEEREIIEVARYLMERSAAYFAAQIAGLAEFKQQNLTVIMEGSFYWKTALYQGFFHQYLARLSPEYKINIVKTDNSPIIGGARLVT